MPVAYPKRERCYFCNEPLSSYFPPMRYGGNLICEECIRKRWGDNFQYSQQLCGILIASGSPVLPLPDIYGHKDLRIVKCHYCRIKNTNDAPFCSQCGAPLD